jgi:micrococcal nuclease
MAYKKTVAILAVATAVGVCLVAFGGYSIVRAVTKVFIDETEFYPVTYVKDGDTFDVKIGRKIVTVRMLGIDTPETVDPGKPEQCYGKEASDETKRLLTGKSVRLKLNPNREEKDRYGRYLAFVYLDEVMVNQLLLEKGFAREYTFGKAYLYQREFRDVESQAKQGKKGLWGECLQKNN